MIAAKKKNENVIYVCQNRRLVEKAKCTQGKSYTEYLILPPIVEFLAGFIQDQIDFYAALDAAATLYGKSVTEEAIEAAIGGELASVKAGRQRLIEAISLGILTTQEAAAKMVDLREQESRLTVELSSIAEKTTIMSEWQSAIDALRGRDISQSLYKLAEQKPIVFRRLLSLVFEPNSLRVRIERTGNKRVGMLEGYKLTEAMAKVGLSIWNNPGGCV